MMKLFSQQKKRNLNYKIQFSISVRCWESLQSVAIGCKLKSFSENCSNMDDIELLDIDELNQIIREAISKNLHGENTFKPEELQIWNDAIVHQCLDELSKLSKPYKFIVTCIINQRDGAGFYSHSSCFLNTDTDSIATIRWDNDVMHCVVSVYSLALN